MNARSWKLLVAGLIAGLGSLQAWDSGAFSAGVGTLVAALAIVAVAVPTAAALFSDRRTIHLGAVLASAMLLVAARVVSPVPLRELLLVAFFPAMVLLVWSPLRAAQRPNQHTAGAR